MIFTTFTLMPHLLEQIQIAQSVFHWSIGMLWHYTSLVTYYVLKKYGTNKKI